MKEDQANALVLIWLSVALVMNNLKRMIYYFGLTHQIEKSYIDLVSSFLCVLLLIYSLTGSSNLATVQALYTPPPISGGFLRNPRNGSEMNQEY
jgi:hypothetical protein